MHHFCRRHGSPDQQQPAHEIPNPERVGVSIGYARMGDAALMEHQEIFIVGDDDPLRGPCKC